MSETNNNSITRYSDEDLAEFKALVDSKLEMAKEQMTNLEEQIQEISEISGDEHGGDWVDDSSTNTDIELLNSMALRQRKYIQDLQNAQLRIQNKTYGICVITGELIDKRRLLAVPTTTKSLVAKTDMRKQEEERLTVRITDNPYVKEMQEKKAKEASTPKIITKVIKKSGGTPVKPIISDDDDDLDLGLDDDITEKLRSNMNPDMDDDLGLDNDDDLGMDDDDDMDDDIDFDEIPDEDSDDYDM